MDESALQKALTTRINLQIVISSIPVVEEHMDLPLTRWLDSVPMPPEMPAGEGSNLSMTVGSDLSRMAWSAFGHPAGFIPKMSDYLQKSGMTPRDLALINEMGDAMEPNKVGSWIEVSGGKIHTGWQFREQMALDRLAPFLGDGLVVTKLMSWTVARDVVEYRRFRRSIGKEATSLVELALPGETAEAQLALARQGFADLGGCELPDAVADQLAGGAADVSLAIEIDEQRVLSVSLLGPGVPNDSMTSLCNAAGVTYSEEVGQVQRVLKSDGIHRVEYRTYGELAAIDIELIPNQLKPVGAAKN